MSDKTPQLAKVRTFADDMKKAKSSGSESEDSRVTTATNDSSKNESTPTPIPKKVDAPAPPPPPHKPAEKNESAEKKSQDDADDAVGDANPPFHKLEKNKSTNSQNVRLDTDEVSDHPESILDDSGSKHLEVGAEESSDATIVSDRKRAKSSLFSDMATELTTWARNFKNTYITPPKPSYRISKSERRAGVLHQAVGSTGTANVEHGSIEERIRSRYQASKPKHDTDPATDAEDAPVDPAFLPELPPGEDAMARATDATTTPRKSVQSTQPDSSSDTAEGTSGAQTPTPEPATKPELDLTPIPAPDSEAISDATWDTDGPTQDTDTSEEAENETLTAPVTSTAPDTEKSTAATIPDAEVNESPKDSAPGTSSATANPTAEPAPEPIAQSQATSTKTQTPAAAPEAPTDTPPPPESEQVPATPQVQAAEAASSAPAPVESEPTPTDPQATARDAQQPEPEPTSPTPEPAYDTRADVSPAQYDEELDEEELQRLEEQAQTNRLSFQIVSGVIGVLVLAVLGYSIASFFTNGEAAIPTEHVVGDTATTFILTNHPPSHDAVLQALRTTATETAGEITQVTPYIETEDGYRPAAVSELEQYLAIAIPDAVSTNVLLAHLGFRNDTPFMYLNITDERQTFGALLRWEQTMAPDVEMFFGITSVDTFRDAEVAGYDARVGYQGDTPVLTYAVVEGHVFITTTPAILERLIPSRR